MRQCEKCGTDSGACVRPEGHQPPCAPALTTEQHEQMAVEELFRLESLFRGGKHA